MGIHFGIYKGRKIVIFYLVLKWANFIGDLFNQATKSYQAIFQAKHYPDSSTDEE